MNEITINFNNFDDIYNKYFILFIFQNRRRLELVKKATWHFLLCVIAHSHTLTT